MCKDVIDIKRQVTKEDISIVLKIIGNELAHMRKNKGISGAELGKILGFSQQQISRYENGVTRLDFGTLLFFLFKLDSSLYDFLNHISGQLKIYEPMLYLKYHFIFMPTMEMDKSTYNNDLLVDASLSFS